MTYDAIKRFFGLLTMPRPDFCRVVLAALENGQVTGRALQRHVGREGVSTRLVPFYAAMSHMEKEGLVEGRYRAVVINGQQLRERYYKILPAGRTALAEIKRGME